MPVLFFGVISTGISVIQQIEAKEIRRDSPGGVNGHKNTDVPTLKMKARKSMARLGYYNKQLNEILVRIELEKSDLGNDENSLIMDEENPPIIDVFLREKDHHSVNLMEEFGFTEIPQTAIVYDIECDFSKLHGLALWQPDKRELCIKKENFREDQMGSLADCILQAYKKFLIISK